MLESTRLLRSPKGVMQAHQEDTARNTPTLHQIDQPMPYMRVSIEHASNAVTGDIDAQDRRYGW